MTNWVYNNMTVGGSKEQIDKFISDMSQPIPSHIYPEGSYISKDGEWKMEENIVFSFWNAVAPTDLEHYFSSDHWYNWNCDNWGTKWDAKCEESSLDQLDRNEYPDGSHSVTYRFETAWGAPNEVFVALAEKYPELEFGITWEEEQGFGAELVGQNGEITETDSWDIPNSHADHVARDKEDSCLCAYESEPENMYDDCPERIEFESNTDKLLPVTDLTLLS